MNCPSCGAACPADHTYCHRCGLPLAYLTRAAGRDTAEPQTWRGWIVSLAKHSTPWALFLTAGVAIGGLLLLLSFILKLIVLGVPPRTVFALATPCVFLFFATVAFIGRQIARAGGARELPRAAGFAESLPAREEYAGRLEAHREPAPSVVEQLTQRLESAPAKPNR